MKELLVVLICALALAWGALFLSTRGVLIWSVYEGAADAGQLRCTYFTGTSVVDVRFWYSPNDLMGRTICPRLFDFSI